MSDIGPLVALLPQFEKEVKKRSSLLSVRFSVQCSIGLTNKWLAFVFGKVLI